MLDQPNGGDAFPDVPANSIKVLSSGALVVGTDLGVMYLPADGSSWQRLGTDLPVTVAMDVEVGPPGDNHIYVATHGRGIWRIDSAGL
jgi:ligand-binding sensor domain-containing protein